MKWAVALLTNYTHYRTTTCLTTMRRQRSLTDPENGRFWSRREPWIPIHLIHSTLRVHVWDLCVELPSLSIWFSLPDGNMSQQWCSMTIPPWFDTNPSAQNKDCSMWFMKQESEDQNNSIIYRLLRGKDDMHKLPIAVCGWHQLPYGRFFLPNGSPEVKTLCRWLSSSR